MHLCAQKSKAQIGVLGNKTITTPTVVNEYTPLSASVSAGNDTIRVINSALNTNSRFAGSLQPGDLLFIVQVQGATINGTLSGSVASPNDTSWGRISNYNSCGKHEFAEVKKVLNSTTILLDCGVQNNYTAAIPNRAQVLRVPRYSGLTITSSGILSCDDWNGSSGGIICVEVQNNTIINAGGLVDASGKGFRGGSLTGDNLTTNSISNVGSTDPSFGANKGEGIVGYENDYDALGGRYGRGAAGNAGGGGDGNNAGGGGGANGGVPSLWKGMGVPDLSGVSYNTAWALENSTLPTLNNSNSAGGGRGGYSNSTSNQDALSVGPGNAAWAGDLRRFDAGGYGGRPLEYTTGRLFMGGGGGAGDQNDGFGGNGGDGGGLIYFMSYGSISGAGTIASNGNNGGAAQGPAQPGTFSGKDGAGGGGAGGTIILNASAGVSGISITANGGAGGNQVMAPGSGFVGAINEAEGPGGGGGGGYIAISNGTPPQTTNGGANGTTNSGALVEFTPNGATKGCAGIANQSVSSFFINATDTTICKGSSTVLSASITGSAPSGTTLVWYDARVAGTILHSGASFTTPVLNASSTYYVGTCPGTYRVAVTVTIDNPPANAGIDLSICKKDSVQLNASGGLTYSWLPVTNLSSTSVPNPIAKPTSTTTYTLTVTDARGCSATDAMVLSVKPLPSPTVTADTTLCAGKKKQLNAGGGTSYLWTPATGLSSTTVANPIATAIATTTYTVSIKNTFNCKANATVKITVNNLPVANAGMDTSFCARASANLNASGGISYSWLPLAGLTNATIANPVASPINSTTYTVTVTDTNNCSAADTVRIKINPLPTFPFGKQVTQCGAPVILIAGTSANSYVWKDASTDSSITIIQSDTTWVTATSTFGCVNSDTIAITILQKPIVTFSLPGSIDTLCSNSPSVGLSGGSPAGGVYKGVGVNGLNFDASVVGAGDHQITYTFVAGNGCADSASQLIHVDICTGAGTIFTKNKILLAPNPAGNYLSVCISSGEMQSVKMEIRNGQGRVLMSRLLSINPGNNLERVDLSEWPSGIYFVKFNSTSATNDLKFVKE